MRNWRRGWGLLLGADRRPARIKGRPFASMWFCTQATCRIAGDRDGRLLLLITLMLLLLGRVAVWRFDLRGAWGQWLPASPLFFLAPYFALARFRALRRLRLARADVGLGSVSQTGPPSKSESSSLSCRR